MDNLTHALVGATMSRAVRGALHFSAVSHFEGAGRTGRLLAMPTFNPLEWRVVIEQPGGFELGKLDLAAGVFLETANVTTAGSSEINNYTHEPETAAILNFFRIPVFAVVEKEGSRFLLVKDLSYDKGIREVLLEARDPAKPGTWYKAVK